ncbi:MAG: hypothetical protein H0T08_07690 [Acidobacteria bacterium]|nr:hypothetical protein [Acidobacteriota bacterium]
MNSIKEANSPSIKDLFKKMLSTSFWIYVIVGVILANLFTSLVTTTVDWIVSKIILPDTLKTVFKFIILLPASFWAGKYLVPYILDILLSKKSLTNYAVGFRLLSIINFLYSRKNQKEVFEPLFADWQEEYFEALFKKEIWKARWINLRYTYAFLTAMWQKSPIGDFIEFISKIAK